MNENIPVLPIVGGTLARALLSVLAFMTHWLKAIARARRHRRDVAALAGFDRYMLADIGINRSDLNDAFSQPFWQDPTVLLRARVDERRGNRDSADRMPPPEVERAFHRPPTNRPARQAI